MKVGALLGENAVVGFEKGIVTINGTALLHRYEELTRIMGNIPSDTWSNSSELAEIIAINNDITYDSAMSIVITNDLNSEMSWSQYELDIRDKSVNLVIDIY